MRAVGPPCAAVVGGEEVCVCGEELAHVMQSVALYVRCRVLLGACLEIIHGQVGLCASRRQPRRCQWGSDRPTIPRHRRLCLLVLAGV